MSTDRDITRIVRSWLRTDEHESADRVLDAVLDQLDTTPQRRSTWWPARRFSQMSTRQCSPWQQWRSSSIALLGISFMLPGQDRRASAPTPIPRPRRFRSRSRDREGAPSTRGPTSSLRSRPIRGSPSRSPTAGASNGAVDPPSKGQTEAPDGILGVPWSTRRTATHASRERRGRAEVGSRRRTGGRGCPTRRHYAETPSRPMSPSPASPASASTSPCRSTSTSTTATRTSFPEPGDRVLPGPRPAGFGRLIDVDGLRLVIDAAYFAGSPGEDRAELQEILDSLQIDPYCNWRSTDLPGAAR